MPTLKGSWVQGESFATYAQGIPCVVYQGPAPDAGWTFEPPMEVRLANAISKIAELEARIKQLEAKSNG